MMLSFSQNKYFEIPDFTNITCGTFQKPLKKIRYSYK